MTGTLSIRDLVVRLGDATVLRGVDIEVRAGRWINIIGPNGAGKTTMLRAVLGAVPYEGVIEVGNLNGSEAMARARAIAYVPQSPVIPPGIRVFDYVLLGRTPHRGLFRNESRHDRLVVTGVLDRLDLRGFADRDLVTLSGGERQRAVLARALAQESSIILLDEPTTALDLGHQQEVLDLVEDLRQEHDLTVLATLHDLTLAGRYGDEIAVLAGGRIVACGAPAEVLSESLIASHFNATVKVIDDIDGPVIVPVTGRPNKE